MASIRDKYETDEAFEEAIYMSRNRKADKVHDTLEVMQHIHFQVGDVLIKKEKHLGDDDELVWTTEPFSSVNSAPRKYEVVHVDKVGLPYVSKISMKGAYCGDIKCMAGFDFDWQKFEYDQDFLDHQILAEEDEKFDPQEVYKEKRDEYFKTRPKRKRTKANEAEVLDGDSGSSVSTVS